MEREYVLKINTKYGNAINDGSATLKEHMVMVDMIATYANIYDVIDFLQYNKDEAFIDDYCAEFLRKNERMQYGVNAWLDKQYQEAWDKAWIYFKRIIGHPVGLKMFFDQMNQGMYRNPR